MQIESVLGAELVVALQQHGQGKVPELTAVAPDELWPTFVAQLETTSCELIVAVLGDLSKKAMGKVVQRCLRSPRDFWKLVGGALIPAVHSLHGQPRCAPVCSTAAVCKILPNCLYRDSTSVVLLSFVLLPLSCTLVECW